MIPTIGAMIGGYIILRCVELACRAESHFSGKNARSGVQALAMLTGAITFFITAYLVIGEAGNPFGGLVQYPAAQSEQVPPREDLLNKPCPSAHARRNSKGVCFCDPGWHEDPSTFRCIAD